MANELPHFLQPVADLIDATIMEQIIHPSWSTEKCDEVALQRLCEFGWDGRRYEMRGKDLAPLYERQPPSP